MFYPHDVMYYGYGFWPLHLFGSVISLLFWIFIILLVLRLIKRGRRTHWEGWGEHRTAMGILRERFAKGEISSEEFEERRKVLEQK